MPYTGWHFALRKNTVECLNTTRAAEAFLVRVEWSKISCCDLRLPGGSGPLSPSVSCNSVDADDPDFTKLRNLFDELEKNFTNGIPADVFPVLKYFPSKVSTVTMKPSKKAI